MTRLMQTAAEVPQAAAGVITQLRAELSHITERDTLALQERTAVMEQVNALLLALQRLQRAGDASGMRVRTALVTARSAPAHERAIRTLMDWRIEVDEAMFLGGLPKGEFLREFEPDFFFDDQTGHVDNASPHVPSGHVSAGIANA